jgi:L-Ala-D/L-Glu epimerase
MKIVKVEVFPVSLPHKKPFTIALDKSVYTLHDVYRVMKAKAADVINIKVAKCGGINPCLEIDRAVARESEGG